MDQAGKRNTFGIAATLLLLACSNDSEKNVIVGTSPFYRQSIRYDPQATERLISATHRFADANGMDFLIARDSLPPGDFNVHAVNQGLNLQIIHTASFDRSTTDIVAVSREKPTEADRAKVHAFVSFVQGKREVR
jgi:hypothetical protein